MTLISILYGVLYVIAAIVILGAVLVLLIWFINFHPKKIKKEHIVCLADTPKLKPGQKVKIMTWNVQYMASTNYFFFYEAPKAPFTDSRPSKKDITQTFNEVARVIKDENPDIILLQEVDDGSKRTDYEDQLDRLIKLLPKEYSCYTSSLYWWSLFVPHERIMGSIGMKLCVISKYQINNAIRYQLPLITMGFLPQQFYLKRAVLQVNFPVEGEKDFIVFNTHLDAFSKGTNTMERQIAAVMDLLKKTDKEGNSWIIGGDFNLIPPNNCRKDVHHEVRKLYNPKTEIKPLYDAFKAIPSIKEIQPPENKKWFTWIPNNPGIKIPMTTLDYIFHSDPLEIGEHFVRQHDTKKISDHMPLITNVTIPK